jgi:hypothetical protein
MANNEPSTSTLWFGGGCAGPNQVYHDASHQSCCSTAGAVAESSAGNIFLTVGLRRAANAYLADADLDPVRKLA